MVTCKALNYDGIILRRSAYEYLQGRDVLVVAGHEDNLGWCFDNRCDTRTSGSIGTCVKPSHKLAILTEDGFTYICMQATPQDMALKQVPRRMHPHEPTMFNESVASTEGREPSILAGRVQAQLTHGYELYGCS